MPKVHIEMLEKNIEENTVTYGYSLGGKCYEKSILYRLDTIERRSDGTLFGITIHCEPQPFDTNDTVYKAVNDTIMAAIDKDRFENTYEIEVN